MIPIDKKNKYALEDQVISKMFRDKRFRTRVIPNKKKEYKNERCQKNQGGCGFRGLQYEPWET
jgi:hypothetical protein|tara:strand:+ start:44 stop:232 length:189 start_codon:yes stop_codon:yes gene_type:complete